MKFIRNALWGLYVNLFMIILLLFSSFYELIENGAVGWIQWLLLALIVISGILNLIFAVKNIINTCRLYKNGEYNSLRKYMKVLKLGSIPYFVLNFAIYFLLFMVLFAATHGVLVATPIPFLFLPPILFAYLTVLFTSSYGIGFLAIIKKEKRLKSRSLIIHVLLQLCFVLDIISTIILLIRYKVEQTNNI